MTLLLEQGWLLVDRIGLVDNPDIILWNGYLAMLKAIHVRLYVDDDILVWNHAKTGVYSPKVGYLQMILDRNEVEYSWRWKVLWKFKCPLKEKLFCWFLLSDKALTWDVICRKGKEGPGRCYLYKMDSESNFHLGVECSFSRSVWLELEFKLNIKNLWSGNSVNSCLKNWCLNVEVKHIRSLHVIVLWFLWKTRNWSCFEDYTLTSCHFRSLLSV